MIEFFPSRAVAVEVLGFAIHWYGLLYLASFLIAWYLLPRLQRLRGLDLNEDEWSTILSASVIGVIAGGRLGYVLFYAPDYFLSHPFEVVAVWQGGMSFHGGFIGVVVALSYVLRHRGLDEILRLADVVVVPVAIGLALGRVGNFINQELYGPVTSLPWGVSIPGVEGLRHPTPIYASCKDLFIALMCFLWLRRPSAPGSVFGLFMVLYGILRFSIEWLRVQDVPPTVIAGLTLTRGQLLTVPVFLLGVAVLTWSVRRARGGTTGGGVGRGRAA